MFQEQNTERCSGDRELNFEEKIERFRKDLDSMGKNIMDLRKDDLFSILKDKIEVDDNHSEAYNNIILAYRHIEDARMRLGKVFQMLDGGVSCYKR